MLENFCRDCLRIRNCEHRQGDSLITCEAIKEYVGMENKEFEMNCFANSALQAIFSISDFREGNISINRFQKGPNSFSSTLSKIHEKLMKIVKNKDEPLRKVDISEIRKHLRNFNKDLFEIGDLADSMEAFSTFMTMLHKESLSNSTEGCRCVSHEYFNINTIQHIICSSNKLHKQLLSEDKYTQNIIVEDLIKNIDFKYRTEIALENISTETYIGKTVLFKLRSFSDVLKTSIYSSCFSKSCEICDNTLNLRKIELRKISKVFTLQLVWNKEKPDLYSILQVLKSVPLSLNLQDFYLAPRSTAHFLRGMIVRISSHYVYIVRNDRDEWRIINDSFVKAVYTSEVFCLPFFFLTHNAYPVGLFYEELNTPIPYSEIQLEYWIIYEKAIYLHEIHRTKQISIKGINWICFYCKQDHFDDNDVQCKRCKAPKIRDLGPWECEKCDSKNKEDIFICDFCFTLRFKPKEKGKNYNCKCNKDFTPGLCLVCDFIYDCFICESKLFLGMTIFCVKCDTMIFGKNCKCQNKGWEPCCKFCFEKLTQCKKCRKYIFKTDSECCYCKEHTEVLPFCNICRVSISQDVCEPCCSLVDTECPGCGEEIDIGCFFICPVCDEELKEGYCANCDYDVDFKRFVCGSCRENARRCFACGYGLILKDEEVCHICKTINRPKDRLSM